LAILFPEEDWPAAAGERGLAWPAGRPIRYTPSLELKRRYFLFGSLGAALPQPLRAVPRRRILIALLDGFGPGYLESSDMPNLKRICREGAFRTGSGVIPSVTNVNNASLVTGSFPSEHGITTNYYHDRETKRSVEMESANYLLRPTVFEKARALGRRTALVTSKDKVRTLCGRGAGLMVSAEKPEAKWLAVAGKQENMYSPGVNYWIFRAARRVLQSQDIDLMYLSTTDYMMHTYPPGHEESQQHLHTLDKLLADILDDHPKLELYLTADHGMNAKTLAIDPSRILAAKSIASESIPIIRDKHKTHHQNLGGSCYVYLADPKHLERALDTFKAADGVEEVYDSKTAAGLFHLHPGRIGDIFLLARKHAVFGELYQSREDTKVRSHGSRHEADVPLIIHNRKVDISSYNYNLDLTRRLNLEDW
jgi:phosphonoacetate hydrolase